MSWIYVWIYTTYCYFSEGTCWARVAHKGTPCWWRRTTPKQRPTKTGWAGLLNRALGPNHNISGIHSVSGVWWTVFPVSVFALQRILPADTESLMVYSEIRMFAEILDTQTNSYVFNICCKFNNVNISSSYYSRSFLYVTGDEALVSSCLSLTSIIVGLFCCAYIWLHINWLPSTMVVLKTRYLQYKVLSLKSKAAFGLAASINNSHNNNNKCIVMVIMRLMIWCVMRNWLNHLNKCCWATFFVYFVKAMLCVGICSHLWSAL